MGYSTQKRKKPGKKPSKKVVVKSAAKVVVKSAASAEEKNDAPAAPKKPTVLAKVCFQCRDGSGELITCDNCPASYHLNCIEPPLLSAPNPKEPWFCPMCYDEEEDYYDERQFVLDEEDEEFRVTGFRAAKRVKLDETQSQRLKKVVKKLEKQLQRTTKATSVKRSRSVEGKAMRAPRAAKKARSVRVPKQKKPKKEKKRKIVKAGGKKRLALVEYEADVLQNIDTVVDAAKEFGDKVDDSCCSRCSSHEAFRAVFTDDEKLLEMIYDDRETVADPTIAWSCDHTETPVHKAIRAGNLHLVQSFLRHMTKDEKARRVGLPQNSLERSTGSVSHQTFGHAVREIKSARGGREGNNAFVADNSNDKLSLSWREVQRFAVEVGAPLDILEYLWRQDPNMLKMDDSTILAIVSQTAFYGMAEAGLIAPLRKYAKILHKKSGHGLNDLHVDVLSDDDKKLPEYRSVSATKKMGNPSITPVHLAAINPNGKYLKHLCEKANCQSETDGNDRTPAHFAACCSTSDNLKYLVEEKKCDHRMPDRGGVTPLQLAIRYGKAHNIQILLQQDDSVARPIFNPKKGRGGNKGTDLVAPGAGVNDKSKATGKTMLNIAAKFGHADVVKEIVAAGADPLIWDKEKMIPLAIAAQHGNVAVAEALLDGAEKPEKQLLFKDRCARLPIHHAVKNGHFEMTKFLLQKGCPADVKDSSGNSLVHYATAYGWSSVLDLLQQANAALNVMNDWKISPMFISMLKGHMKLANVCVNAPGVDVNGRDTKGKTILHYLIEGRDDAPKITLKQVKYIVNEKGADVHAVETTTGDTPLHLLCKGKSTEIDPELADILFSKNANPQAQNLQLETPVELAVKSQKFGLIEILLKAKYEEPSNDKNSDMDTGEDAEEKSMELEEKTSELDEKTSEPSADRDDDGPPKLTSRINSANKTTGRTPLMELVRLTPPTLTATLTDGDEWWATLVTECEEKLTRGGKGNDHLAKIIYLKSKLVSPQQKEFVKIQVEAVKRLIDYDSSSGHLNRQDKAGNTALMHVVLQASSAKKKHEIDPKKMENCTACFQQRPLSPPWMINVANDSYAMNWSNRNRGNMCPACFAQKGFQGHHFQGKYIRADILNRGVDARKMLALLIDGGADPSIKTKQNDSPIFRAIRAGDRGGADLLRILAKNTPNMNEQDKDGKTALVLALEAPNPHELVKIIAENGGDVDMPTAQGETALQLALTQHNSLDLARVLVQCGADVNLRVPLPLPKKKNNENAHVAHLHDEDEDEDEDDEDASMDDEDEDDDDEDNDNMADREEAVEVKVDSVPEDTAKRRETIKKKWEAKQRELSRRNYVFLALEVDEIFLDDKRKRKPQSRLDFLRLFAEAGADINVVDRHYSTPLISSVRLGDAKLIEYLLTVGKANATIACHRKPRVTATHQHEALPKPKARQNILHVLMNHTGSATVNLRKLFRLICTSVPAATLTKLSAAHDVGGETPLLRALRRVVEANINTSDKAVYTEKVCKLADPSLVTMKYLALDNTESAADAAGAAAGDGGSVRNRGKRKKFSALEEKAPEVDANANAGRIPFPTVIVSRVKEKYSFVEFLEEYIKSTKADLSQQVVLAEKPPKPVKRIEFKSDEERVIEQEVAEKKAKDDAAEAKKPWCKFGKLCFHRNETHLKEIRHKKPECQANLGCTALHLACQSSMLHLGVVKTLVSLGARTDVRDSWDCTPLIANVRATNKTEVAEYLLEQKETDVNAHDAWQITPIAYAVNYSGRRASDDARGFELAFQMEELLLQHKANVNCRDIFGRTPLHYVFVGIKSHSVFEDRNRSNDPIELVNNVLDSGKRKNFKALEIDVKDAFGRTAIHYCCMLGAHISAKCLMDKAAGGASITSTDNDGNTPFQHALIGGHMGLASDIIGQVDVQRKLVDYRTKGKPTITSFRHVLQMNWMGIAYLMIRRGLPVISSVADALSALKFQLVLTLLTQADPTAVKSVDEQGRNLFHSLAGFASPSAAARRAFSAPWSLRIAEILIERGVDPAAVSKTRGDQPLHRAVRHQHFNLAKFFLERGANVNLSPMDSSVVKEKEFEWVPLQIAVKTQNSDITKLLLDHGAHLTVEFSNQEHGFVTCLHLAVANNDIFTTRVLLNAMKSESARTRADFVNAQFNTSRWQHGDATVLHLAVRTGRRQMVELLLERGANVNHLLSNHNKDGDSTAFHVAVRQSNLPMAKLLVKNGASIDAKFRPKPKQKLSKLQIIEKQRTSLRYKNWGIKEPAEVRAGDVSVLHLAMRRGDITMVEFLLENGANPNVLLSKTDTDGGSCLHMAIRKKNYKLAQLLINYHADPNLCDRRSFTPLMLAVRHNDVKMAAILLRGPISESDEQRAMITAAITKRRMAVGGKPANPFVTDGRGWNAIHHCISPFGRDAPSHENHELLELLVLRSNGLSKKIFDDIRSATLKTLCDKEKEKYKVKSFPLPAFKKKSLYVRDKKGVSTFLLACEQTSGVMLRTLEALSKGDKSISKADLDADRAEAERRANVRHDAEDRLAKEEVQNLYKDIKFDWNAAEDARTISRQYEAQTEAEAKSGNAEKPPVDPESDLSKTGEVYEDAKKNVYDVLLNNTDIGVGRYGKVMFYKMQVIYNKAQDMTMLWTRWGRIGEDGMHQCTPYGSTEETVKEFEKIFKSKTGNVWEDRDKDKFVARENKYSIVRTKRKLKGSEELLKDLTTIFKKHTTYEGEGANKVATVNLPPSKLPRVVQGFVHAIEDISLMTSAMRKVGIRGKFAVGDLTDDQLREGREKLDAIEKSLKGFLEHQEQYMKIAKECMELNRQLRDKEREVNQRKHEKARLEREKGRDKKSDDGDGSVEAKDAADMVDDEGDEKKHEPSDEEKEVEELKLKVDAKDAERSLVNGKKEAIRAILRDLANKFYRLIPVANFNSDHLPEIINRNVFDKYRRMMSTLLDLQVATRFLLGAQYRCKEVNPLDYCYANLGVKMWPVDDESEEFESILKYAQSSQSVTRDTIDVFHLERESECKSFDKYKNTKNRMMLWHGSSIANFVGILTEGLRIAPAEADASGYAFGKGVYFADQLAKSMSYATPANWVTWDDVNSKRVGNMSNVRCMLLCEVALGEMYETETPEYMEKAKDGFDSTKGIARRTPDFRNSITSKDGVVVPSGPIVDAPPLPDRAPVDASSSAPVGAAGGAHPRFKGRGKGGSRRKYGLGASFFASIQANQVPQKRNYLLQNNEYIVYKEDQVRIRYLVLLGRPRSAAEKQENRIKELRVQARLAAALQATPSMAAGSSAADLLSS